MTLPAPAQAGKHAPGPAVDRPTWPPEPGPTESRRSLEDWATLAAVALVGAIALLLALNYVRVMQADGYKALYDGRWIAHHGIPRVEGFAIEAHGRQWVDEQWLGELVSYEVWRLGGCGLLALFSAGSMAAAYMILAALMRRLGATVVMTICCAAFAALNLVGWSFVRAQNLALPLFALMLTLCLTDARRPRAGRRLVLLLPLLAIWANVHGSALLGAAMASAYLAYRFLTEFRNGSRKAAAGCGALALGALLTPFATPYGFHIVHYYAEFVGNLAMRAAATEWDPPTFPDLAFFQVWVPLVIVGVLAAIAIRRGRRISPLLLAGTIITALAASRETGSIAWFAMLVALLLAEFGTLWFPSRVVSRPFVAISGVTAVLLGGVLLGILATRSDARYESQIAVRALDATSAYAGAHPCARILADNWDASALLWHDPSLAGRIGFDARLEQFPQPALEKWIVYEVGLARSWPSTIRGYQILVANSTFTPALTRRLSRLPGTFVLNHGSRGIAVVTASDISC